MGFWNSLFGSTESPAASTDPLAAYEVPATAHPFWGDGTLDGNLFAAQPALQVAPIDPFYGDGTADPGHGCGVNDLGW